MSRQPFDEAELGGDAQELDAVAAALERYAASRDASARSDLTARILAAVDDEPIPSRGLGARLAGMLGSPFGRRPRLFMAGAVAMVVLAAALVAGQIGLIIVETNVGTSPPPGPVETPTGVPTPTEAPSPTVSPPTQAPSPSPTESATPTASPDASPAASPTGSPEPSPTATDDDNDGDDRGGNRGPGGGDDGDDHD